MKKILKKAWINTIYGITDKEIVVEVGAIIKEVDSLLKIYVII